MGIEISFQEILSFIIIGGLILIVLSDWASSKSSERADNVAYYQRQVDTFYHYDNDSNIVEVRSKFSKQERIDFEIRRKADVARINEGCKKYGIGAQLKYIPYFKDV